MAGNEPCDGSGLTHVMSSRRKRFASELTAAAGDTSLQFLRPERIVQMRMLISQQLPDCPSVPQQLHCLSAASPHTTGSSVQHGHKLDAAAQGVHAQRMAHVRRFIDDAPIGQRQAAGHGSVAGFMLHWRGRLWDTAIQHAKTATHSLIEMVRCQLTSDQVAAETGGHI